MKLPPATALADLDWIPRNKATPLARLGLRTLNDLVVHYPRRIEDRRRFDRFPDDELDHPVCLFGIVRKTALKRWGRGRSAFEVTIENESAGVFGQPVTCRWFNLPYIQRMISSGQRMVVYGRPKKRGRQIVIDHPEFETIDEEEETLLHLNRLTPVHPAGEGITPRLLRTLVSRALDAIDLDVIPSLCGLAIAPALRHIHFPDSLEEYETARRLLVQEEFFGLQLVVQSRRAAWRQLSGSSKVSAGTLCDRLVASLPFALTESQRAVIGEIRADLAANRPMNRLLQGDVGSGKTLVALATMLLTVEAGQSAALMAPTQILAEQHFLNFRRLVGPLGVPVTLRTGDRTAGEPLPLFDDCPGLIVGTHALLYENTEFDPPGLVVIDEQHKFGVLQRARLVERSGTIVPDVLVMTATPIPRTLTQTFYGDLDVSVLREKPSGRGVIETVVRDAGKLPDVAAFLRRQLDKGRQAYIVYPLVEDSDKLAAKSATAEFTRWESLLAPHPVGLLHGRMPADEKEVVMNRLREGTIAALVATTVIEVGVDVPNANIMVVENAERFGLAQLHQLRGRIGRGAHKSFCILLHDPAAVDVAEEKLSVLAETCDGFAIAEADLRLRGPGDLVGTAQTGLPALRLGNLFQDAEVMEAARQAVANAFAADPGLTLEIHRPLREYLANAGRRLTAAAG